MSKAIGIDLGTTFSAVAIVDESGRPRILKNSHGSGITPSVIYFGQDPPLIGEQAKEMQALGEADVAYMFKRSMGTPHFLLNFGGKDYSPVDLSALILKQLKSDAETELGEPVTRAVITVPAYFNNHQRNATIRAGQMAGLEVLRIINEPTAAALAYGLDQTGAAQTVLVYDLGGGTFDVTVARFTGNRIDILSTGGDHELGGKDWDDRIANYLAQKFQEIHDANPLDDAVSAGDLLVRCESGKKQLSSRDKTKIAIAHEGVRESFELTREHFAEITKDLMERTQRLTEQTLEDAGLAWGKLDGVLLVGGSTRMPMVWEYVETMSGKKPRTGVNVDEAVALGAAIQASFDAGDTPQFTIGGGKKNITDVMSHSLGMVSINEDHTKYVNSLIIPKNQSIPCVETRPFTQRVARRGTGQTEVYMLQGENADPTLATILGKYTFSNIVPVANGEAVLDISYSYDINGVVTVSAVQRETGKTLPLLVQAIPDDMSWLSRPPDETEEIPVHVSVLIAVDLSGSMSGSPLAQAQAAAEGFLKQMDLSCASVGLIGFADQAKLSQALCSDANKLTKGIKKWSEWMSAGSVGWGNSAEPFTLANSELANLDDPRFLIVLTDGCWSYQEIAIQQAKALHKQGVEVVALGFGGADQGFLKAIATSDENALFTDMAQLTQSFSKIAKVLTESSGGSSSAPGQRKSGGLSFFN